MSTPFSDFFRVATASVENPNGVAPYDYQFRLANAGTVTSRRVAIPTGLGKTAAIVLAWLWNRVANPDLARRESWPRRLVYCLPMRTLVEQTRGEIHKWLENLLAAADAGKLPLDPTAREQLQWLAAHSPVILMGGEENDADRREWDIHPERPAILIGTQDMLLSRALNRGYGMARARWPMHFGLLNNDALWVLDETQLMGVAVRTSAQLEGLRDAVRLGTAAPCATWWASATLDERLLSTPDHPSLPLLLKLEPADEKTPAVAARINAVKKLTELPFRLDADSDKPRAAYIAQLAATVREKHQPGHITLIILNRVARARELYEALEKSAPGKTPSPPLLLIHSRFRPLERERLADTLKDPTEKIIVSTQAIEAGVDLSARVLITELAPWSSLVQRFGRCNRKGEFNAIGGADIFWLNIEPDDDKNAAALALPYLPEQLATARERLRDPRLAASASPAALGKITAEATPEPLPDSHILRRRDLVALFDTTPDIAGLDIDVGRYIRDGVERDVQVFWRTLPKDEKNTKFAPPPHTLQPQRSELVRAATHEFQKFAAKNKGSVWKWDAYEGEWQEFRDIARVAPGQIYLVNVECGGYSVKLGWTGEKTKDPIPTLDTPNPDGTGPAAATGNTDGQHDDESLTRFQSIEEHTAAVEAQLAAKLRQLPAASPWKAALEIAAHWHDIGKAHPAFQDFLRTHREVPARFDDKFLAKSEWNSGVKNSRPHFRHELASALAWLQTGRRDDIPLQNLVAYLIAAHHGKIRLSIRAMPGEISPPPSAAADAATATTSDALYARGIRDGDTLFDATDKRKLAFAGVSAAPLVLDLSPMQMGDFRDDAGEIHPSWTSRVLTLRDSADLGIFRLAWLEALLRAADALGSRSI